MKSDRNKKTAQRNAAEGVCPKRPDSEPARTYRVKIAPQREEPERKVLWVKTPPRNEQPEKVSYNVEIAPQPEEPKKVTLRVERAPQHQEAERKVLWVETAPREEEPDPKVYRVELAPRREQPARTYWDERGNPLETPDGVTGRIKFKGTSQRNAPDRVTH